MQRQKRIEAFWDLVEEALGHTAYDTIRLLKQRGANEEEIKAELRRRHGLNALQASQALREYAKEQKEAKRP
jgi:hypothetical protein